MVDQNSVSFSADCRKMTAAFGAFSVSAGCGLYVRQSLKAVALWQQAGVYSSLSEKCLFVGRFPSNNTKFGAKNPPLRGNVRTKLNIWEPVICLSEICRCSSENCNFLTPTFVTATPRTENRSESWVREAGRDSLRIPLFSVRCFDFIYWL